MSVCCPCGYCCTLPCFQRKWQPPRPTVKKEGTELVELKIGHVRDAHAIIGWNQFGGDDKKLFIPVTLVPSKARNEVCCCKCCWTSIPEGFNAVVSRWGADVKGAEADGTWSSGCHWFWPWYRVNRLVSKQLIIFDTPVKQVKSKDHIPVTIDVLIVVGIDDAYKFIYGLGPEKLDDLLRASQEEMLRTMASKVMIADIYDLHGESTTDFVGNLNEYLSEYGCRVHHFTVRDVFIPAAMAGDFEDKTLYESKTAEKMMEQEMNRLNMDNEEARQKLREECENKRMAEEEKAVTTKAQIMKEVSEVLAITKKELALTEARRSADIMDKRTTADLDIAQIASQITKLAVQTQAEVDHHTAELSAKAEMFESKQRAKAKEEAAEKINEGKKKLAQAEGAAAGVVAARRAQEQEMLKLDILESISANNNIKVITSLENNTGLAPDNSLVTQIVQQGMEAFRMKLADVTTSASGHVQMSTSSQGGVVRPVSRRPAQQAMT